MKRYLKNVIMLIWYARWMCHYYTTSSRKKAAWDKPSLISTTHGYRISTRSLNPLVHACLTRGIDVYGVRGGHLCGQDNAEMPGILLKNPPARLLHNIQQTQYLQKRKFKSPLFPDDVFWWIELTTVMVRPDMGAMEFQRLRSEFVAETISALNRLRTDLIADAVPALTDSNKVRR